MKNVTGEEHKQKFNTMKSYVCHLLFKKGGVIFFRDWHPTGFRLFTGKVKCKMPAKELRSCFNYFRKLNSVLNDRSSQEVNIILFSQQTSGYGLALS